ncbi:MAG: DUF1015 domain-containing protein, partial [Deltaproteobacteria bacterium]|nr:DUF1015 domain-containing protein [Deltaproteobacteria bacterium]
RSPKNIVRLELNRDADPYASAAATLANWIANGTLNRLHPAIFLYTQAFELDGRKFTRNGWVVRIRLEEFAGGRILPHERTFPKAKEDRLRLLAATRANISSVFGLYPSGNRELEALMAELANRPPLLEATDDLGILNQVRAADSPAEINTIQRALEPVRVLIADGHHRYETALEYRRRLSGAKPLAVGQAPLPVHPMAGEGSALLPQDYVMMTLVAFNDPGLVILPTHRVIQHLSSEQIHAYESHIREKFTVEEFGDADTMLAQLQSRGRGHIGAAIRGSRPSIVHLRNPDDMSRALPQAHAEVRKLDVAALHGLILDEILGITSQIVRSGDNISYTIDGRAALAGIASGAAAAAFLLSPPTVYDVEKVSDAGATMPEKSTYFYPKLQTGLLINPLD